MGKSQRAKGLQMNAIYIGIDPGKSGGIAAVLPTGEAHEAHKMPEDTSDLADLLRDLRAQSDTTFTFLEYVHSSPQMGVKSSFTFGQGFGRLEAALSALRMPWDIVRPQVWQKELGCMSKGDKNVTKGRAAAMFPGIKITHATADALLIAEYCRRIRHGE